MNRAAAVDGKLLRDHILAAIAIISPKLEQKKRSKIKKYAKKILFNYLVYSLYNYIYSMKLQMLVTPKHVRKYFDKYTKAMTASMSLYLLREKQ